MAADAACKTARASWATAKFAVSATTTTTSKNFFPINPPFTVSQFLKPLHDLFARNRMFSNAHPAGIVDSICNGAGNGPDGGFAKALRAEEPTRFQAVDEDVRLGQW